MNLDDGQMGLHWLDLARSVEQLARDTASDLNDFTPTPSSDLGKDDQRLPRFKNWPECLRLIQGSVAHLHSAAGLVTTSQWLHPAPMFTLVRAAIEHAAAAHWLLAPDESDERLLRLAVWAAKDIKDYKQGLGEISSDLAREPDGTLDALLSEVADAITGITSEALKSQKPLSSIALVKALRETVGAQSVLTLAWRHASSYAHGRRWSAAMQLFAVRYNAEGELEKMDLTTTPSMSYYVANPAFDALQATLALYMKRAGLEFDQSVPILERSRSARRDDGAALSIRRASASDTTVCRSIAATLPDYFSAEDLDAIERYAGVHGCWIAKLDERPTGFLIAEQRSATVAEIAWMATAATSRGQGVGTALLAHVMAELSSTGVQLVEVKTLDASAGYEPYESTHAFWRKHGFVQVDTVDPLPGWRPGNPAAIYVAALTPTR